MFKMEKNDKAFKELKAYADKINQPLKEVLLSDFHLLAVSEIFYKHMPKMVKWSMKQDKFTDFYKNHREKMVGQISI